MRTFEGTITIKWHKNDNGDVHPLTIDCDSEKELDRELNRIKADFLCEAGLPGYDYKEWQKEKKAYSVTFAMNERI